MYRGGSPGYCASLDTEHTGSAAARVPLPPVCPVSRQGSRVCAPFRVSRRGAPRRFLFLKCFGAEKTNGCRELQTMQGRRGRPSPACKLACARAAGVDSDFIQGNFWGSDFCEFLAATLSVDGDQVYRASPRPSSQPLLHQQQQQLLLQQFSLYEQEQQQEQQRKAEAKLQQQVLLYEQQLQQERKAMVMQEFMSIVESFNSSSTNSMERGGDRQRETWTTTRSLSPRRETHTHTPDLPRANSPTNFDIHHNPFRAHQHSKPCKGGVNQVNQVDQVNQDPRVYTHRHFAVQRDLATRVAANLATFRKVSGHFLCARGGVGGHACSYVFVNCVCIACVSRVCVTRQHGRRERKRGREGEKETRACAHARTHTHTRTHTQCTIHGDSRHRQRSCEALITREKNTPPFGDHQKNKTLCILLL